MKYMPFLLILGWATSSVISAADQMIGTKNLNLLLANSLQEDDFCVVPAPTGTHAVDGLSSGRLNNFFKNIYDYAQEEQRYFPSQESKKVQECAELLRSLEHVRSASDFVKKVTQAWVRVGELADSTFTTDEDIKKKAKRVHTLLMHGLFLRTILVLNTELNKHAVVFLREIELCINFWEYQLHHPTYYFLHKSPFTWFSKDSQKLAIKKNLYLLRHYQSYFFKAIGRLRRHLDTFSEVMPLRSQREWLFTASLLMNEHFKDIKENTNSLKTSEHDLFLQVINHLEDLSQFDARIKKELYPASIPSHFVRHWMEYTAAGLTTAFIAGYAYAHSDKFANLIDRAKVSTVKTYNDTIRGPLLKIKEALFGTTGKDSADAQVTELSTRFREKVAQLAMNGGLPVQRDQLKVQYRNIVKEYKDFFIASLPAGVVLHEGSSAFILKNLTDEVIDASSNRLDITLLNTILGAVGYQWERSKLEFKASLGFKIPSVEVGGTKAQLIDKIAPIAILYTQCRLLTVEDKARIGGEAAEIAAQIGDIFAKQGEMVLTQNRVTISALALIPAAILAYFGYKVVGKVGGYVLSDDYDYSCLRRAFFSAARVLNLYESSEYNHDQIKDEDLGNLLYSLQTLKHESQFLTEKDRWEFSEDIKQLGSPSMNVRQKLRLLNIMINRYAFLHVASNNEVPHMSA